MSKILQGATIISPARSGKPMSGTLVRLVELVDRIAGVQLGNTSHRYQQVQGQAPARRMHDD